MRTHSAVTERVRPFVVHLSLELRVIMNNSEQYSNMVYTASQVCDGKGVHNIARVLLGGL